MEVSLRQSVATATVRPEALRRVEELYRSVQAEIDARRPTCVVSGRCCRFEEFGHRLYITTLELAHFTRQLGGSHHAAATDWDGAGCPFQRAKLCSVHAIRPFGCRMFFCDATSTDWQNAAYERFHADLKRLHEEFEVPYFYVEWRQALEMLGLVCGKAPR